ncbi:MAG: hypothetical protein ACI89M_002051 [Chitinophagales bacterium]|jgi:hypothetical protein
MTTITINIPELNEHTLAILQLLRTDKSIEVIEDEIDIPQSQKDEVMRRIKHLENHPEDAIDIDSVLNKMESKYGL